MDEAGISTSVRMNVVGHASERIHQRYNNSSPDIIASTREKMNEFRRKLDGREKESRENQPETARDGEIISPQRKTS